MPLYTNGPLPYRYHVLLYVPRPLTIIPATSPTFSFTPYSFCSYPYPHLLPLPLPLPPAPYSLPSSPPPTPYPQDLCHQVSLPLYNILHLDDERLTIRVEPLVSVGDVTAYLVQRGYTLAVCLEVAEATLGGLAMGVGMTTYSHKVGGGT